MLLASYLRTRNVGASTLAGSSKLETDKTDVATPRASLMRALINNDVLLLSTMTVGNEILLVKMVH